MIIEWLNAEGTMLFGDRGNLDLLKKIFPHATIVYTPLFTTPLFALQKVDLVCVGSMSERMQKNMILWLNPYTAHIKDHINQSQGMLWFGNSGEILGKSITRADQTIQGLHIYSFSVNQETIKRYNALVGINTKYGFVVGHKSTFSQLHETQALPYLGSVENGFGNSLNDKLDGIHDRNLIMSTLMGPLLVLNPQFTHKYLQELTQTEIKIPFESDLLAAYTAKVQAFKQSKTYIYEM